MSLASTILASDALLPARNQMALSLGWHIILACFGMAFPAMIFVVHRKGLRGDVAALELAKRWSKVAGVLFAIGAVSGTILSFELGLPWLGLMGTYGDVVGLAFALGRHLLLHRSDLPRNLRLRLGTATRATDLLVSV